MKKTIYFSICFILSICATAQPLPSYVPTASLSAWYSFSGNTNDLSGNGNNATVYGATLTSDANGVLNSAYMFTPNNKILTPTRPPSMLAFAQFTSSAALFTSFNANSLGTSLGPNPSDGLGHCLISSDSAGYGGLAIGVVSGSLTACMGTFWMRQAFPFAPGTWYHVGANFDATTQVAELFVNGASIGTFNVPAPFQNVYPCLYHIGFISTPLTWNVPFNGKIDEAGIWNRVLTKCEIEQLYNTSMLSVTIQPQNQLLANGSTAYFTTGSTYPNTTYQWQVNSGSGFVNVSNGGQYGGASTGTLTVNNITAQNNNYSYQCVLTSGNCSVSSNPAILMVTPATGLNPINGDEKPGYLFPNPTNGLFTLYISEAAEVKIFNSLGALICVHRPTAGNQEFDLKEQPEGIYFVSVQQTRGVRVLKIMKID